LDWAATMMNRHRLTPKQREQLYDVEVAKSLAAKRGRFPICRSMRIYPSRPANAGTTTTTNIYRTPSADSVTEYRTNAATSITPRSSRRSTHRQSETNSPQAHRRQDQSASDDRQQGIRLETSDGWNMGTRTNR
jgi:hypothetical protein